MAELTPAELRILVSVSDEGGFTAAGTTLGMTQSAVSHAVRGMERKLGTVLFARARTGATPTPAGERAAAHARRILRLYEVMVAEVRADNATGAVLSGPLHVAAFRSAALHLLPDALERLARRHPGLRPEVRVVRDVGPGPAGEVADGRADLAIATLGGSTPMPAGLITGDLLEEAYALAHPSGHTAPRSLPLVDWQENCSSYTAAWWSAQDWLPPATITAEDDGTVLALVAQGRGMAVMPELSLRDAPPSVETVDLGPDRPTRRIGYATTPELARTAGVRALIRELRAGKPSALPGRTPGLHRGR
ncbi:LysR family transcriptional regulator [Microtetraspora fusca]|uniref:LysR family transcriptional regulator n=1 Tax=Microtetraspora fusca TaxID=1997 RepID=A0ABW6VFP2_MICFU|nr:LysR family transcriptional regulator [Microtetraspora fusca]